MATSMWRNCVRQGCRLSRCKRQNTRCFTSKRPPTNLSEVSTIRLTQPLPGLEEPKYADVSQDSIETKVTTLENGMKVATDNAFGTFCTVGVLIDSGSRYEVAYPSGVSHFLEKLAFGPTRNFKSAEEIDKLIENYGGIKDAQASRDVFIYALSLMKSGIKPAVEILSEVVQQREFSDEQIEECVKAVGFELEFLNINPQPDQLLVEMIHKAGFRGNTVGLPKLCPPENLNVIDKKTLYTFMNNFHTPERTVLAGVGIEHEYLVDIAREYFLKQPIWKTDPALVDTSKSGDNSIAQYTGGQSLLEKDLSNVSLGPNPMPELAHLVIGLESCSHREDDFIPYSVLNMLLGGGSSFSAGGPGKGMFTRLYSDVLNVHHWINSAVAINYAYEDTGMFTIQSSAHPNKLGNLADVVMKTLLNGCERVRKEELDRAKKQLQSLLLMNLENRPVIFEDVGRQILSRGERLSAEYYIEKIGSVTADDIIRVSKKMLQSKPAVAAYGTLNNLPSYDRIQNYLATGKSENILSRIQFS